MKFNDPFLCSVIGITGHATLLIRYTSEYEILGLLPYMSDGAGLGRVRQGWAGPRDNRRQTRGKKGPLNLLAGVVPLPSPLKATPGPGRSSNSWLPDCCTGLFC
ncbi:hypothetical protein E2C01_096083 [Portunus trituberculatus]|uniref:Uncharacterized protein n=1 Tax=Portunus trituberculatus TaxID=210409 RepID=A0A5B7JUQ0_PORTR|nr:hypothetical protein [Portunus trituberculatus]